MLPFVCRFSGTMVPTHPNFPFDGFCRTLDLGLLRDRLVEVHDGAVAAHHLTDLLVERYVGSKRSAHFLDLEVGFIYRHIRDILGHQHLDALSALASVCQVCTGLAHQVLNEILPGTSGLGVATNLDHTSPSKFLVFLAAVEDSFLVLKSG